MEALPLCFTQESLTVSLAGSGHERNVNSLGDYLSPLTDIHIYFKVRGSHMSGVIGKGVVSLLHNEQWFAMFNSLNP